MEPPSEGSLAGRNAADNTARRIDPIFHAAIRNQKLNYALDRASKRLKVGRAVVALAWLISEDTIPVVGVRKTSHVHGAVLAAKLHLPQDIVEELDRASEEYRTRWGTCYRQLY